MGRLGNLGKPGKCGICKLAWCINVGSSPVATPVIDCNLLCYNRIYILRVRSSQVTTLHGDGNDCTAFDNYYTAFVVDCTALGRVVLPNGTARHFVTRAAPSPRALRGSWFIVPRSITFLCTFGDRATRKTMSMNVCAAKIMERWWLREGNSTHSE